MIGVDEAITGSPSQPVRSNSNSTCSEQAKKTMALKITLKPGERVIIGGAVITNGKRGCDLMIETHVPILRQKDIMSEKNADTPCKRIYFLVQLMYVDPVNMALHQSTYWEHVKDVIAAAPSTVERFDQISRLILDGLYYQALKATRELIDYEATLMKLAQKETLDK